MLFVELVQNFALGAKDLIFAAKDGTEFGIVGIWAAPSVGHFRVSE
jgi:hypothetical protein